MLDIEVFLNVYIPLLMLAVAVGLQIMAFIARIEASAKASIENIRLTRQVHTYKARSWGVCTMAVVAIIMLWEDRVPAIAGNVFYGLTAIAVLATPFIMRTTYHLKLAREDWLTPSLPGTYNS